MRPERIVFAAEFWHGSTGAGLAHGLRRLGVDVVEVDLREPFLRSASRALRSAARLIAPLSARAYNATVDAALQRSDAPVLLTVKGSYLSRALLQRVRRRGVLSVNFYPDVHFGHAGLDAAALADYGLVATTKSYHLDPLAQRLGPERVAFVPHGYSSAVHAPRPDEVAEADYRWDVLYVGNPSPAKVRWLDGLVRARPGLAYRIAGADWRRAAAGLALARHVDDAQVSGDAYARAVRLSRISLGLHHGPAEPGGWEDQVSTRTFEIPACKGFMLHVDNAEVRALFDVPSEIDVFATPDALAQKVGHYLGRPALRRRMLERAHARAVPAYSYDRRAAELLEAIERRLAAGGD